MDKIITIFHSLLTAAFSGIYLFWNLRAGWPIGAQELKTGLSNGGTNLC